MRYLLIILLLFFGCDEDDNSIVGFNLNNDRMGDITYFVVDENDAADSYNGYLFTTNVDNSGNSGPQIVLYKYILQPTFLDDIYNLGLNGHGFLYLTNDGESLYLQSKNNSFSVAKYSTVGTELFFQFNEYINDWMNSGLAYNSIKDSLLIFYKSKNNDDLFRAIYSSKDNSTQLGSYNDYTWYLDENIYINEILSCESNIENIYCLAKTNESEQKYIIKSNYEFEYIDHLLIEDSLINSLSLNNNSIILGDENYEFIYLELF